VIRPHSTVRNLLRGGVNRLDRREANAVNRSIVASFVLAVILAVVAYFTMLSTAETETGRLLGVVGVILFATVAIAVIMNFALMIRERLARWDQRDRG
jgi:heme/copper-type cytochrome/quinol oxidase subunit 4